MTATNASAQSSTEHVIQEISNKYQCDPHDPLFAILEKVSEHQQTLTQAFFSSQSKEREALEEINQTLHIKVAEMNQAIEKISMAKAIFETNAFLIAESTDGLEKYWKQIHWYHALTGMIVTLILCSGVFGAFYLTSIDRKLSQAGIRLKLEERSKESRITLIGKKVLASGRSDNELVAEFSK